MASPSLILFFAAATLTLGGGLGVVMTRNIVYAAFALLASLMGVAGLFLLAFAEFLALVQVLIYGGAVVILILFALMLTRIQDFDRLTDNNQWPLAIIAAITVFGILVAAIISDNSQTGPRQAISVEILGESLFTEWAIPFEIASLVLLVALIGAILLVRAKGDKN